MTVTVATLGYPRIGPRRELKTALESYWAGRSDAAALRPLSASDSLPDSFAGQVKGREMRGERETTCERARSSQRRPRAKRLRVRRSVRSMLDRRRRSLHRRDSCRRR